MPFLWMVEYTTDSNPTHQCQLNMTFNDLAYVFGFNLFLIFLPAIGLSILYVVIIVKVKKRHVPFGNVLILNTAQTNKVNVNVQDEPTNTMSTRVTKFSFLNVSDYSRSEKSDVSVSRDDNRSYRALSIISCSEKANKKAKVTITISIITIVFYCCQLPARVFLCLSYLNDYMLLNQLESEHHEDGHFSETSIFFLSFFSHLATFIYFLHCISNPIIYNLLSSKFRKAFWSASKFRKMTSIYLTNSKNSIMSKSKTALYA